MDAGAETGRVRRRRVFYIPGYDPFPPRRYRELYRREGAAQARISGYRLAVTAADDADGYGWTARLETGDSVSAARLTVLVWSDIVRASMERGVLRTYAVLARTFWIYMSTGAMGRLFRLRRGPVITAMYPVAMLLLQLALALAAGILAGRLALSVLPGWAGWAIGLAVVATGLRLFRRLDRRFYVYYLLNDYAFTAHLHGRTPRALEERLDGFAETVAAALAEDVDEVLVVGHSSGAHLAVSVLARLVRQDRVPGPGKGPALAFLSLGQAIPMQSFLPQAHGLRADLYLLARTDALTWIDISAPGDGCCYALCDPVSVSGAGGEGKRWPLVLSAAFSRTLRPETWKRLRWRFFRLHFQYLCAFDNPGEYDYFAITAGPVTLAERFRGRRPSASRNERVLSPHLGREAP